MTLYNQRVNKIMWCGDRIDNTKCSFSAAIRFKRVKSQSCSSLDELIIARFADLYKDRLTGNFLVWSIRVCANTVLRALCSVSMYKM